MPAATQQKPTRQHGPAIAALREKDGYSQTGLAKAAGIGQSTLSLIESGDLSASMKTLNRIAHALAVPVRAILREDYAA